MGWENLFHCEWNPFGQKVLKHHFPNSISYNDITKTDFSIHRGQVDILTGGFPCQPYSTAGLRKGKADERHLFPDMLRCIKEVKPRWIIGENVRGLVSWNGGMVFNEVYNDLEREGYEVQSFLIPAAGVNAPHQRYRIWFVAYSNNRWSENMQRKWKQSKDRFENAPNTNCDGLHKCNSKYEISSTYRGINAFSNINKSNGNGDASDTTYIRGRKNEWFRNRESDVNYKISKEGLWEKFPTVSPICDGDDGIPNKLDGITFSKWRKESIKAGGNAIVPQVALEIFKSIQEFELMVNK